MMVALLAASTSRLMTSKSGRRLLIAVLLAGLLVPTALVTTPAIFLYAVIAAGSELTLVSDQCGGSVQRAVISQPVAGYQPDQLAIAASIIDVGAAKGIRRRGQVIAVMVAMGESSLRNLNHGDAADNTTIGVFQQGETYGPRQDRMDVTKAASAFYNRMLQVPAWETTEPTLVGHAVQNNRDPDHYAKFFNPATTVVQALTAPTTAGPDGYATRLSAVCPADLPTDAQQAASELMTAIRVGKMTFLEQQYREQVENMANGTATPECALDITLLQILLVAVANFDHVGVSDLNRRCTGVILGAGPASQHWKGKAVDFYALNRRSITGSDSLSLQLIHRLNSVAPHGSGLGQRQCRAQVGNTVEESTNFTIQFADTCNHLHVQVP